MKKRKFYKKKKKEEKLPSNSRFIPDKILTDHTIFFVGILCITLAIVILAYDFYGNYKMQEQLSVERGRVIANLNFWNREVLEKPNYRDGYFNLALIYYQLGDVKNSSENLNKAMEIDPNFEMGKQLQKLLRNF